MILSTRKCLIGLVKFLQGNAWHIEFEPDEQLGTDWRLQFIRELNDLLTELETQVADPNEDIDYPEGYDYHKDMIVERDVDTDAVVRIVSWPKDMHIHYVYSKKGE